MFKKGISGNPNGRPKKEQTLTDALKNLGEKNSVDINGKKYTWKEAIGFKLWSMAISGDRGAIIEIYNRLDGKAMQNISISDDTEQTKQKLKEMFEASKKQ